MKKYIFCISISICIIMILSFCSYSLSSISFNNIISSEINNSDKSISNINSKSSVKPVSKPTWNIVDRDNLYGICENLYFAQFNGIEIDKSVSLINALGTKSWRCSMSATTILSDSKTVNKAAADEYHSIIKKIKLAGVNQIIVINHSWFWPDTGAISDGCAVPERNLKSGSKYMKFLAMYKETWYTMAKEFPEITYWEVGNEPNHDPFLHKLGYLKDKSAVFSFKEKANITTDMLYYASKGIHEANRNALVVLPGLAPVGGMEAKAIDNFLEVIYKNIQSGKWGSKKNNDFFEVLCWHPYTFGNQPDDTWVEQNNNIYNIAKKYGDDGKKVLFTEFGFTDMGNAEADETQGKWLKDAFSLIKLKMPYVESMHIFRLFEDESAVAWGGSGEIYFGLFREPHNGFGPKAKAYAVQQAFGGKGALDQCRTKVSDFKKGDNVALYCSVEASATCEHPDWGWAKKFINDGKTTGTGWSIWYEPSALRGEGGAKSPNDPHWLQFEFISSFNISQVILYPREPKSNFAVPREINIQISNDGKNWTTVVQSTAINDFNKDSYKFSFKKAKAKYVKVNFTKLDPKIDASTNTYLVQLCEIQIIKAD